MKSASQSAQKFVERASVASQDYVSGAEQTSKDQSAIAIAGKANYQAALTASFQKDSYAKGLQKSGKAGWLAGVKAKGADRFATGVASSAAKYATESAKFDGARNAAASLPRGVKGSPANIARVTAVVNALRQVKG